MSHSHQNHGHSHDGKPCHGHGGQGDGGGGLGHGGSHGLKRSGDLEKAQGHNHGVPQHATTPATQQVLRWTRLDGVPTGFGLSKAQAIVVGAAFALLLCFVFVGNWSSESHAGDGAGSSPPRVADEFDDDVDTEVYEKKNRVRRRRSRHDDDDDDDDYVKNELDALADAAQRTKRRPVVDDDDLQVAGAGVGGDEAAAHLRQLSLDAKHAALEKTRERLRQKKLESRQQQ
jgi:hypothetical protein